jgi:putative N6-adenine-specific DNA methylase
MGGPPLALFAACAPGLEPLLLEEARSMGLEGAEAVPGGVTFGGDFEAIMRANLELGLASRVLVRVAHFRATHLAELAKKAERVDWGRWVQPGADVTVHATARRSRLYHTGAIAERVARAAGAAGGDAPSAGERGTLEVHARFDSDRCTLSLDTSGEPLHRRGYRLATAKAPLREDLARALVLVSGWDRRSPFVDPLMGSGTIVIEAALLARGLPPAHLRERFAFMGFAPFDMEAWARVRTGALERALPSLPFAIHGRDRNAGAVEAAAGNAERAGVRADVELVLAPLGAWPWTADEAPPRGALVTNPPHGRRIGRADALVPLYQRLGKAVRALPPEWRVALVVSDRRLALRTGLPLQTALLTDQGGTKVRFLVRA